MNLRLFARILRRGAWLLAALTIIGAISGAAFAYLSTPTYGVRATVYVSVEGGSTAGDLQAGNVYVLQKAATFASLASTDLILDRASAMLNGTSTSDLRNAVTTTAQENSGVIDVLGSGSSPSIVTAQTNAVAQALISTISSSSEQPSASDDSSLRVTAKLAQPATVPTIASAPQPRYDVFAGAIIGLILGLTVLVVRQAVDNRVYSLLDLPADRSLQSRTIVPGRRVTGSHDGADDLQMEAMRGLRATMQFGSAIGQSIVVAPVGRETRADTTAEQFCRALLEVGTSVVLVDVDFRPQFTRSREGSGERTAPLGTGALVRREAGISEVVEVEETPSGSLHRIRIDDTSANSQHLLSTPAMQETLQALAHVYSCAVLVCPPLTERADAVAVAAVAEQTIVVATGGATRIPALRFALSLLRGVRAHSVNLVLINGQAD